MDHLKFENTQVYNFDGAFRGMRNPKNSWNLSDSIFGLRNFAEIDFDDSLDIVKAWVIYDGNDLDDEHLLDRENWIKENGIINLNPLQQIGEIAYIGPKDMKLAQTLIRAGSEHRKFLRQIFVCVDITAPLFWWSEYDTYKVATVANSTSKMHKLASTPITKDCFKIDSDFDSLIVYNPKTASYPSNDLRFGNTVQQIIDVCEALRQMYNETKNEQYWKALIEILPESWVQTRTVTLNYETLLSICSKGQRRNHKLTEWCEDFISWARTLPYAQELIFIDEASEVK